MAIKTLLHHSIPSRSWQIGGLLSEPLRPTSCSSSSELSTVTKCLAIELEFTLPKGTHRSCRTSSGGSSGCGVILSLVWGGYLRGVENLDGQRDLVAWLHGGRMVEEAVKFSVEENGRTLRVLVDSWGTRYVDSR